MQLNVVIKGFSKSRKGKKILFFYLRYDEDNYIVFFCVWRVWDFCFNYRECLDYNEV